MAWILNPACYILNNKPFYETFGFVRVGAVARFRGSDPHTSKPSTPPPQPPRQPLHLKASTRDPTNQAFGFVRVGAVARYRGKPSHPGVELRANLKSISRRCHPILLAFVWELTAETIDLPLSCLLRDVRVRARGRRGALQGYLAHKKLPSPRTLP